MERKGRLKGKKIWIEEDLTWEEQTVRWRLREVTKVEMERGRKVLTAHDRIRIDGEWWW